MPREGENPRFYKSFLSFISSPTHTVHLALAAMTSSGLQFAPVPPVYYQQFPMHPMPIMPMQIPGMHPMQVPTHVTIPVYSGAIIDQFGRLHIQGPSYMPYSSIYPQDPSRVQSATGHARPRCTYCEESGHVAADCPVRREDRASFFLHLKALTSSLQSSQRKSNATNAVNLVTWPRTVRRLLVKSALSAMKLVRLTLAQRLTSPRPLEQGLPRAGSHGLLPLWREGSSQSLLSQSRPCHLQPLQRARPQGSRLPARKAEASPS